LKEAFSSREYRFFRATVSNQTNIFAKIKQFKVCEFYSLWKPERSANGEEVLIPSMEKQRFQKEPGSTPESNMRRIL